MEELRWVLLVLGAFVIAGVYFFGDPARRERRAEQRRREAAEDGLEPGLRDELDRLGETIAEERGGEVEAAGSSAAVTASSTVHSAPERVVALYVKAPRGTYLRGRDIFTAAEKVGLSYGELNIFHRFNEAGPKRDAVYSLANLTKPGDFDQARMDTLMTPGLCLFMTLPNPLPALDAWDAMLATGRRLADLLEADLQDDSHSSLIRQRIAQLREEMREHDRQRAAAGG